MKTIINIKSFISIACVLSALLFACENPWMAEIVQEKTITFDSNGGSPVPSQKLFLGESATKPADPTRDGYVFDDWYEDNGSFEKLYNFDFIPTHSMTLYAKWDDDAVSVNPNITSVEINITGPVTGETPVTTPPAGGNGYTCSPVEWIPNATIFQSSTVYTAKVTVMAKEGCTFTDYTAVRINGTSVNATITPNTINLSYTFNATLAGTVSKIEIKDQPTKIKYTHEDTLELNGLKVRLIYDDDSYDDVDFIGNNKNITANPANGAKLSFSTHNGKQILVSYGNNLKAFTNELTVEQGTPTVEDFEITGKGNQTIGSVLQWAIIHKDNKTQGQITVNYKETTSNAPPYTGYEIKNAPAGTYTVTFNVAEYGDWKAATGLLAGTLVISDVFTSGTDLNAYLQTLSGNTYNSSNPLLVEIKTSDPSELSKIKSALLNNQTIYVKLDLSDSSITSINNGTFQSCATLVEITIPDSVTSIGNSAFYNCKNLTSVNIPDNVTSIGNDAFGITSLRSVTIPNKVTSIGERTFANCYSLTSVIIGEKIESIGDSAFFECHNLESIIIPSSVNSIEKSAFAGCELKSVEFKGTISSDSFSDNGTFIGNLRAVYYATDQTNGTPGTYTRSTTGTDPNTWTRQQP